MNAKTTIGVSCFTAALLISFCAIALAEDKSNPAKDAKEDAKKSDTTAKDAPEPKPDSTPAPAAEPLTQKQKAEKALREAAEERQRRREAWEANEKRRREAIKRVRDENTARKKQLAGEPDPKAPPPPLPEDQMATVTMKNGVSFGGVVIGETPTEVTVKIEGGEMTIDKTLIESIRRPAPPAAPDKK